MRFYSQTPRFAYWRDRRGDDYEVDIIAELGDRLVPFEVKYQDAEITPKRLKGLRQLIEERKADQAYVITQRWKNLGLRRPPKPLRRAISARIGRPRFVRLLKWLGKENGE